MAMKGASADADLPTNVDMGTRKANWHLWGKKYRSLEVYAHKIRGHRSET